MEARETSQGARAPGAQKLVDAALELVAERGVSGAGVAEICKRAGVVKTGLYYHFGSKDGLLAAMMVDVRAGCLEGVLAAMTGADAPFDKLDRLIGGLRALVEERGRLLRVKQALINELASLPPELAAQVVRLHDDSHRALEAGLAAVLGRRMPDLDLLAHTIIALIHAAQRRHQLHPEEDLGRLFADLRRVVLVLIANRVERAGGV